MIAAVLERLPRIGIRRVLRGRRPSARVLASIAVLLIALGGAWLWLRDSSLVAIKRVSVIGVSGPDAARIRSALVVAARNMTTLHVRIDALRTAVGPYPVVKDLRVSTVFPHGLRIQVVEQVPVAAVVTAGRAIAVAGDGTLLHDVEPSPSLATVPLQLSPGGSRLTDHDALAAVQLMAAAPDPLQGRVSRVSTVAPHGLVAQLRNGPSLYFGDPTGLAAKWTAAATVLADASSAGAVYIDVSDPARPAAGGVAGAASGTSTTDTTGAGASGTSGAAGTTSSSGGSSTTGG
jgi:cell division protein FtsQ